MGTVADLAGRAFSYMTKSFVINACGTIDDEMRAALPATDEDRAFLAVPANLGGSSIISPDSRVLAGPMGPEEGVLYADIDLELAVRAKLTHDFAGHYNRPDVFQLHINTAAPRILQRNPMQFVPDQPDMAKECIALPESTSVERVTPVLSETGHKIK